MKHIGIALLGLGVVGSGTYKILCERHEDIIKEYGLDINVVCVMEKDVQKAYDLNISEEKICTDIDDICKNENIQIVAEFFGGTTVAKEFLLKALRSGKSIITSNKELMAKHWCELEEVAKSSGAGIYFEASCVGGVPVIRALHDSLQGNSIKSLKGIVNGTTNYILTKMIDENLSYEVALKQAQDLGFAECNPDSDVLGFDSTYKLSILSSLAYKKHIDYKEILRIGITDIKKEDIAFAKNNNYTIKLLAVSKQNDDGIEAHVYPCLISNTHILASVSNSFNALFVSGNNVDDLMFYGRGAGALPTGSAIVSDIVYAGMQHEHISHDFILDKPTFVKKDFETDCYFNFLETSEVKKYLKEQSLNYKIIDYKLLVENISESCIQYIVEKYKPISYLRIEK